MADATPKTHFRFWLWLIRVVGVIVPRCLRADWRREWEAELRHREAMLAEWDRLNWRNKLDLLWRSASALWDAVWLQPKRLEDEMFQDLRYGLRLLLKNPGFTLVAVFTLALGICGVTTQFSIVDAVLLRGLPFPEPDRLVRVTMRDPSWAPERDYSLSAADVMEIEPKLQSFEGLAQYFFGGSFIVTIHDTPQRLSGSHVTSNFFSLLGVKPALGRDFNDSDNQPGVERVTIISDALWRSEFGGDPNIVGRKIRRLNGQPATVIGVMPPGFQFPRDQLWIPIFNEYSSFQQRPGGAAHLLGRLKPGMTINQATSELEVNLRALAIEYPKTNARYTEGRITPLLFGFVGRSHQTVADCDVWRGHRSAAHRLRQRHEHAVCPDDSALARVGDSGGARRVARPADAPDARRKPGFSRTWRSDWRDARPMDYQPVRGSDGRAADRGIAVMDALQN